MQTTFDRFDSTIDSYLSKALGSIGLQYSDNQIFKIVLNAIKSVFQNVMLYIEDAFVEQNIETATRKKSVYSLAKLSGYEPYYGSAATGTVLLTMKSSINDVAEKKKIYIDNYSYIEDTKTGIRYMLWLENDRHVIDLSKPLVSTEVRIIQGTLLRSSYTAKGEELETVHATTQGMYDKSYMNVYVNNVKYDIVSNLYDMTEDGNECVVSTGFDNEIDVTFGDGVHGKTLNRGDNVSLEYISHEGTNGNISSVESSSFKFVTSGSDWSGDSVNLNDYMKITQNSHVSGGTDSDTISDVRRMVGYNSRSNVLASVNNYALFLKHFSYIGNFNIWPESNSNILCISAVTDKIMDSSDLAKWEKLSTSDILLNDRQKDGIIKSIENSEMTFAGTVVKFVDPIIYKYAVICYVKPEDEYYKETITDTIKAVVAKMFVSLTFNTKFVSKSDIIKEIVENVKHVKSVVVDIISEANEMAYHDSYYYKYDIHAVGDKISYDKVKYNYETDLMLGLDNMGNISVESSLYMPLLHGDILYYPNKTGSSLQSSSMRLDPVNVVFI